MKVLFSQTNIPIFHHSILPYTFFIWHLNFDIWILVLNKLTLPGSFYLKTGNKLFQFFPATFWAFRLPSIVLSDAKGGSKFLFTFRASIVVVWHPLSLLSPRNTLILI